MRKSILKLAFFLLIIFCLSFFTKEVFFKKPAQNKLDFLTLTIETKDKSIPVEVELAKTSKEIQTGLMFRKELAENKGMLFIFDSESVREFWMKNTLIPLDIIFITKEKVIALIAKSAKPCESAFCQTYSSEFPILYVLEINGGFCDKNNISIGDKVNF